MQFSSEQKHIVRRKPGYSHHHPVIPRLYVPEWKNDMVNRKLLIENAEGGYVPHYEHDEATFLEKREQLHYNTETRESVESKFQLPSREQLMKPQIYDPTAKYRSSLLYLYYK